MFRNPYRLSITTCFQVLAAISFVVVHAGDTIISQLHNIDETHSTQHKTPGEPYFVKDDNVEWTYNNKMAKLPPPMNVSAQLGSTIYLHCKVNNLGGKTVSWLKRRNDDIPYLLTFGLATYSYDSRFQIIYQKPNDWKLQIQFPQIEDEGIYECQVSTNPPLVRRTLLKVIAPEIEIVDERDKNVQEKYYKGGSTIELKCIVRRIVGQQPEYIIWHHEDRILNYDTERGGISVKTDLLTNGAISRLQIARASKRDTGNYTCGMKNAHTSVIVHILNGENPAAMQTGTSHRQIPESLVWILFALFIIQYHQRAAHQQ